MIVELRVLPSKPVRAFKERLLHLATLDLIYLQRVINVLIKRVIFAIFLGVCLAGSASAEQDATTWDLTALYATPDDWEAARQKLLSNFEKITALEGTLGKSPKTLQHALDLIYNTERELGRFYSYSSLLSDEDLRDTRHQEMDQLGNLAYAKFMESLAWFEPEVLKVGEKKIRKFIRKNPDLAIYQAPLDNILRTAGHTLDGKGEGILALFQTPMGAPSTIYSLIANSDIPWPEVTLSDGKSYRIDSQGYTRWRGSANRDDRKKVFDAYWNEWLAYRNTVGAILNAHLQSQVALARARNYDSVLQRELDQDNLPEAVYHTLVKEVNAALPTLHRYFKLRAKILGVKEMHYYDIYPPLAEMDKTFDYEASKAITLEAMSVLGDDWVKRQRDGMSQRWAHVYPQQGKRSGAYMNGWAVDVHPYLLLNHNDDYGSLSTLAHEWGHAMHTLYAAETQPYPTYRYATFIAEIPSTSLELILQDYMVKHAASNKEKIFYLGEGLENLRATFFRQTMFAEFELALYQKVEAGEALTGEKISAIYGDILKRYHNHDDKVVVIDDLYSNEWMFIPHFYRNMYVFQYATSVTAGTALYERIVTEGESGVKNYIDLLRAGSEDYPYNLLTRAGVDLAKPEPYRALVNKMNAVMDEMELLLKQ